MALGEYREKRDPKSTPEPFEGPGSERSGAPIFVVQRHDATRLHYDFRLERGGTLASWAVPKGVPLEPGEQRLAVHVEDHPLSYATFEGTIPKGQYGAGTVEIWDHGTYELVEEKPDGGLTVRLHGERLEGLWTLVPAKLSGDPKNWLLLKKRERDARPSAPRRAPRYDPMLATLTKEAPRGEGWLHEVKWDGYRVLAYVEAGEATLFSRRRNPLTERFATVAAALPRAVRTPSAVLDGEVVTLDETGRASFSAMQQGGSAQLLYVFDVLEVDGTPVLDLPFTERRERLADLLDPASHTVRVSEAFEDGEALFEAAKEQGLEGIVSKRADSRYEAGKRSRAWLKVKSTGRQEFLIAGYTSGEGRRAKSFGSLVLAVRGEDGGLRWVGNVGTGFGEKEIERLLGLLRPLERDAPPFPEPPKMPRVRARDVHWVEPTLVAEVEFVEWTHDDHLRAPSYVGLREDKEPLEVVREDPAQIEEELRYGRKTLRLSNLDKPFWPEEGITKGDLLAYYRAVAPALVPHLKNRPFTMKRYPDGWRGDFFFQKDAPSHMPEWIPRERFLVSARDRQRTKRWISAPLVNDEPSLLWMVNMACIDMNTWYSRVDRPDRPDWVLFDLDPSPDVGFPEAVQVALLVKEILDALGLVGFAKTSGSRGIHVLVPVERRYTYDDTREFAEIVAGALARTHRGLVTTEWTKSKRRGVLVDANQNGEGKTIASVYSVRPRAGAPVSTPLRWTRSRRLASVPPGAVQLDAIVAELDAYFRVPDVRNDDWAPVFATVYPEPYWRDYAEPGYEGRWNGLMVRGGDEIDGAVTCVFPSDRIVDELPPRTLLFSEHPVDFADRPGFLPLARESFERLREAGSSFYHVHAPLDMHPEVAPSLLVAQGVGLGAIETYYPIAEGLPGGACAIGDTTLTVEGLADALRVLLGPEILVHVLTRPRQEAGRVAIAAGGGAGADILRASLERGCRTYVTGNAATNCVLDFVQAEVREFRALAEAEGVALVDAMHYGLEKPPQLAMVEWFRKRGLAASFMPDGPK